MASDKVIIARAVAGPIHTPSMSPPLPVMPAEITVSAIAAVEGTNVQQGMQVSNIMEVLGLKIATPAEAREISRAQRRRQGRL